MKDSFGGSIMLYILIFFLGIYIILIALTLRCAQAFKVKNAVIDIIEQNNGVKEGTGYNYISSDAEDGIKQYIKSLNISPKMLSFDVVNISENLEINENCFYRVNYVVRWDIPFLGLTDKKWIIKGESKNVKYCDDILEENIKYS